MSVQPPPKAGSCLYCGNNPAPHFLTWYTATVDIMFAGIRRALFYNGLVTAAENIVAALRLGDFFIKIMELLGMVKYTSNRADCVSQRGGVLWDEAQSRGIHMSAMKIFGRTLDMYVAERDGKTIRFMGLPRPKTSGEVLERLDDKWDMKLRFRKAGLPVPSGEAVSSWKQAEALFPKLTKPVIVKPRTGSRGRHTTTFIYTLEDLKLGFKRAKQLCYWVIIEEHLDGPVYRGTVINYELQGVLRGDPPSIVGDGVHTIEELVKIKNSMPHEGVADITLSSSTNIFLTRQSLNPQSVPALGREIFLTEKIGVSYGGSSSEDFDVCHPDTKRIFVDAARIMGDQVVGFDFIIPDITKSYREQRAGFIECNSLPFINLHHDPLLGTPRNVAAALWDLAGFPQLYLTIPKTSDSIHS